MNWLIYPGFRSSAVEKTKFRQDIPGLNRTRKWAAEKAEQARKRAVDRDRDPRLRGRDDDLLEEEQELLQEFVDFRERREREKEDERLDQRAALLMAQQEDRRKNAEREKREMEERILRDHRSKEAEIQARNTQKKEMLRNELKGAGMEPQQIEIVLASGVLDYSAPSESANAPISSSQERSDKNTSPKNRPTQDRPRSPESPNRKTAKSRLKLPW